MNSDQYWDSFSVLPVDAEYLTNFLLEEEEPQDLETLVWALIQHRNQQLVELAEESLSQGRIYRPKESYQVGEKIIFPHLGNLLGEVVDVREGQNPEYGSFSVIKVRTDASEREFAADLPVEHPLDEVTYLPTDDADPEEILANYGPRIATALDEQLRHDTNFTMVGDAWFVRELIMNIPPLQLNIVEAMLDMAAGGPLSTQEFMAEMEFPPEIPAALQAFSLEYAMLRDRRFDEVGPAGQALWYLRAMEPQGVLEIPRLLRYVPTSYNRTLVDVAALNAALQIQDEWAEYPSESEMERGEEPITVALLYPHWRSGTLPLTPDLAQLFPTARLTDHIRFTFVDGETGDKFPGWVVRSGRYVYGLKGWYTDSHLIPGAYVDLQHGEELGTIVVHARLLRSKRGEWLRAITVGEDTFSLEVTRYPVFCEFSEMVALGISDPEAVDVLRERLQHRSLESLIDQIFRELVVLSMQRAVHVTTLYSVLNLLRRVPPAPVQAILIAGQQYVSLRNNYWSYQEMED
ncbi:MAG TPA: hypothetical protein G4N98_06895 [Thermoflexia bacterium]|nr:hypothetical protein [Thermoflexia bacterium]